MEGGHHCSHFTDGVRDTQRLSDSSNVTVAELGYGPKQFDSRLGSPDPWTDVCRRFCYCTKEKVICWKWGKAS